MCDIHVSACEIYKTVLLRYLENTKVSLQPAPSSDPICENGGFILKAEVKAMVIFRRIAPARPPRNAHYEAHFAS